MQREVPAVARHERPIFSGRKHRKQIGSQKLRNGIQFSSAYINIEFTKFILDKTVVI